MREMVQFGCSLCIIFASLLHACLALYVEQVNERKLVCVCVVHGKAALKPASARHQQAFLGLVLTAARLLAPTKSEISHTCQAPAPTYCLDDVCLLIMHLMRCISTRI
jgi:hypothetical protein